MNYFDPSLTTPFDRLIASDSLQMLKLAIPYIPPSDQRLMAIYIKLEELKHTFHFFKDFSSDIHAQAFERDSISPKEMLLELLPYLTKEERTSVEQLSNLAQMMRLAASAEDSEAKDPMELIKNMLSPEQKDMFDMYSAMFEEQIHNQEEGDDTSDRLDEQSESYGHRSDEAGASENGSGTDKREERA